MKAKKRTSLILSLVAVLVLLPIAAYSQEQTSGPPPTPLMDQMNANIPPVEQPLIPEGVFASELVKALKIGQAQDEAQAENMLSAVGIEPKNGWIAGYPVTPPIISEIEKGVALAADGRKLGMGKNQALQVVGDLKAKLGLSVTPGPVQSATSVAPSGRPVSTTIYKYIDKSGGVHFTDRYESIPKEYRGQIEMIWETAQPESSGGPVNEKVGEEVNNYTANPTPEVINNYYDNQGPPVITYYPPPEPYYYLYSWVPYPFWWSGFYFGGFFILHDFHRHVFFHGRPFIVSNHVANLTRNGVFVVDPVTRSLRASTASNRVTSRQVFNSSSLNRSQGPIRPNQRVFTGQRERQARSSLGPSRVAQSRTFSPSAFKGRFFSSASPRNFSAHAIGGRGSFGGFRGSGGFSGHGGSFGGGARGHR